MFKKKILFKSCKKEYDVMKYSHNRMKEAYEKMKESYKDLEKRNVKYVETTRFLEANYKDKQMMKNNKLHSYHVSSYILERIFNITPDENDSEKTNLKKGIGSEYHQVPPLLEGNYTFYDNEKVEKAINLVDQLPENIDVTYTKSDVGESEVVSSVVENVLKDENHFTKNENSTSQDEDEESFHKKKNLNLRQKRMMILECWHIK
ncbi:hypothetical protein Hanom_Chr12g01123041 [Helianthus anomalus]